MNVKQQPNLEKIDIFENIAGIFDPKSELNHNIHYY